MKNTIQKITRFFQGKEFDYTELPLKKAIFYLAIPMVFEMLMESLFAVVDIYFVGGLGPTALATVGLTESILTIVYSLGFGIAMGATAIVARRVGEKNNEGANQAAAQVMILGFLVSVIIACIGLFFSEDLLRAMKASDEVIEYGTPYMQWMLGGNLVIVFLFLLNGVFRGAGNARLAMVVLIVSNGLNMILDPLFIYGIGDFEGFGLVGAAYATNTGRFIGVMLQLYFLLRGTGIIQLAKRHFKYQKEVFLNLINVSAGGTGQFIISSASWIFLMRIMAEFGDDAVAGYTTAIRVLIFTILPAWGLANAAATLVGQNLGAKKEKRAEKAVWLTAFYAMIFLGLVSVVYIIWAPSIIGIFTADTGVLENGIECLTYLSIGYIFFAYGMVVTQAFNGAGDTRTPTLMNLFIFWMIQIPLAYLLANRYSFGPSGVYLAIIVSESVLAFVAIYLFRRGRWKQKVV